MMSPPYIQHSNKAVETHDRFEHVMAITLDPRTGHREGVIRVIVSREGNVDVAGYIDRSVLYKINGDSLHNFIIGDPLYIKNQDEVVAELSKGGLDFIGLEDPDIWIDDVTGVMHLYFTMPFIDKARGVSKIYLGHAYGDDLNNLEMTMPVLGHQDPIEGGGVKEVSIAPINKKGMRLNLVESGELGEDDWYSVVRVAEVSEMGKPWKFHDLAFHPAEKKIPWIAGHASPGPLLPETFINIGEGKRVGILNGREANRKGQNGQTIYGMFSSGLFIYDYEEGKIDWVSPEPLIRDTDAKTITFVSQFVETAPGEGILYAHVDDSFVRVYTLKAEAVRKLLP